jgi:hypothetical protein
MHLRIDAVISPRRYERRTAASIPGRPAGAKGGKMQLKCSSLTRVTRGHDLGSALKVGPGSFDNNYWNFGRRSDELVIRWVKENVRLKGSYSFRLSLSKAEIANLFAAAFREAPFADRLKVLWKAGFTKEELAEWLNGLHSLNSGSELVTDHGGD